MSFKSWGLAPLTAEMPVEAACKAIFRAVLAHVAANRSAFLADSDGDALWQLRVGLRRFRAALRLFRKALDKDRRREVDAAAAAFGSALGHTRDWDCFIGETLAPLLRAHAGDEGLSRLRQAAARARETSARQSRELLQGPDWRTFVGELSHWTDDKDWAAALGGKRGRRLSRPVLAHLAPALDRELDDLRRLGAGHGAMDDAALHGLRVRLKTFRYQIGFCRGLFDEARGRAYVDRLAAMQQALGQVNDAVVGRDLLAKLEGEAAGAARAMVLAELARGYDQGKAGFGPLWTAFSAHSPFWRMARTPGAA